jgi:membrane protein EpsK
MFPGIIATVLIGIAVATLGIVLPFAAIVILAVVGTGVTIIFLIAVWSVCLNRFERLLFASYLPPVLRRKTT